MDSNIVHTNQKISARPSGSIPYLSPTITSDNNNEDSDADRKGNKNGDGDGNVEGENYDRVTFEFKSAKIIAWNKELDNLPPIGSGWFDTMYCNDEYALRCDSRQDWSIFRRIE
mmetsp:Transcript_9221/g.10535  ORF Transcript_9221/g.10535 Transcript_9221/m.10535 type:complete len:114 (-) Transcript_9221:102-443(-)